MKEIISNSPEETTRFAERFAGRLSGGETICLVGELGSGKTVFAKGLAKGLGVSAVVTSPTFVLMKIYPGKKIKLVHIDAYRLKSAQEFQTAGLAEYFSRPDSVVLIEWADRLKQVWPAGRILIDFKFLGKNRRRLKISPGSRRVK